MCAFIHLCKVKLFFKVFMFIYTLTSTGEFLVIQMLKFLSIWLCVYVVQSARLFATHGLQPTWFLYPWDFPGKSTGVGSHFLLQEIFWTQGLKPGLLHCRQTLYPLSYQESPCVSADKESACSAGDLGLIPGLVWNAISLRLHFFHKWLGRTCFHMFMGHLSFFFCKGFGQVSCFLSTKCFAIFLMICSSSYIL